MSDPLRWPRRALTVPLALAGGVTALVLPLALPACVALDLTLRSRGRLVTRGCLAVALALGCEALGTLTALLLTPASLVASRGAWLRWHHALQRRWCGALLHGLLRIYRARLEVEGLDQLGAGPALVLMRHASLADTLLPAVLIPWRLRFVLKRELLWDPCLDLVGQRLQNAFVQRGAAEDVALVGALGRDLAPGEGVLIYPEGTRFTAGRRAAALTRLATSPRRDLTERARGFQHVLPPRLGGPLALLEAAATADVVFVVHAGLDGLLGPGALLRGALLGARVRVCLWRVERSQVPAVPDAWADWLYDEWTRVEAWVQEVGAVRPSVERAST